MRRFLLGLAAVVATTLVAACDSGSSSGSASDSSSDISSGTPSEAPVASSPASGESSDAECDESKTWDTAEESADPSTADPLYLVRVGQHDCFDRVVMDINGPGDVGYLVKYVPVVSADGSGKPFPVAGKAALQVVVHAPAQGSDEAGHQPGKILANAGDKLYPASKLAGWEGLGEIRFAGSFEGYSTLAIGVRDKLPFRVSTELDKNDQVRHLVIDIAHD
jgi:hypothetical protein